jgi:hypothetical protein
MRLTDAINRTGDGEVNILYSCATCAGGGGGGGNSAAEAVLKGAEASLAKAQGDILDLTKQLCGACLSSR